MFQTGVIQLIQIQSEADGRVDTAFYFQYSTLRLVAFGMFFLLLAAFGIVLVVAPESFVNRRADATQVRVFGAVFVAVFGAMVAGELLLLHAGVALSQRGVHVLSRFRRRLLPWADIVGVSRTSYRSVRYLQIEVAPSPGSAEMLRLVEGKARPWWRSPPGAAVSLYFLGDRLGELFVAAVERYLRDPAARREIGTDAGLTSLRSMAPPRPLGPTVGGSVWPTADPALVSGLRDSESSTEAAPAIHVDRRRTKRTIMRTVTLIGLGLFAGLAAIVSASLTRSGYGAFALASGLALGLLFGDRWAALEQRARVVRLMRRASIWTLVLIGLFIVPRFDHEAAVAAGVAFAFVLAALAGHYIRSIPRAQRLARRPTFGAPLRDGGPPPEILS